jgi:hypothetical protein
MQMGSSWVRKIWVLTPSDDLRPTASFINAHDAKSRARFDPKWLPAASFPRHSGANICAHDDRSAAALKETQGMWVRLPAPEC